MSFPAGAPVVGTGAVARSRPFIADLLELTKPRITSLVVITTAIGFFMGTRGPLDVTRLVNSLLATALVAGGASALNQYLERDLDGLMKRTADRPLPQGRLSPVTALAFGVGLSIAGVLYLTLAANLLAGALAALTVAAYVFVYTPLKRLTPLSTVVGAVPGALPPVGGWAAATGSLSSEAWVLFAIVFLWQLPHFLAIGWMYREDYSRANYPMLPVLDAEGYVTGRHMIAWSVGLIPVSLMPTLMNLTGVFYFYAALALGLIFLATSAAFAFRRTEIQARRLFLVSILYLPLLWAFMVLDKSAL
jgi:protoheme IX farnesyltransferase